MTPSRVLIRRQPADRSSARMHQPISYRLYDVVVIRRPGHRVDRASDHQRSVSLLKQLRALLELGRPACGSRRAGPEQRRSSQRPLAFQSSLAAATILLLGAGCGSKPEPPEPGSLVAVVANFDLSPDREERFLVGLYSSDRGEVGLGSIDLSFTYLGRMDPSRPGPPEPATPPPPTVASFLPIPASTPPPAGGNPTLAPPPGVRGVYGTAPIRFETPGFWEVRAEAEVDGSNHVAQAAFEVFEASLVPGPGDRAPRTVQPLLGDPDVDPEAIDSRLALEVEPADPLLHRRTVADALDEGRPIMVVVSTPVFCVSRFCGPITEEVRLLATRYEERIEFMHLEVWSDFQANELNPWALEWIAPQGRSEAAEPWVFLVDAEGTITNRWDNVASTGELEAAIRLLLGP